MPTASEAGPSRQRRRRDSADGADPSNPTAESSGREARKRRRERETRTPSAADKAANEEESKRVRSGYRDLQAQAEDTKKNLAAYGPEHLVRLLSASEELYNKVKEPNDALLDSKFLLNMSEIGTQMMKTVKLDGGAFDVDDYLGRLARFMGGSAAPLRPGPSARNRGANGHASSDDDDDDGAGESGDADDVERWDWDKLGRTAAKYSRRAPALDFLLGPLLIQQKTRKATQRKPVEPTTGVRAAPAQLRQTDIQQSRENDTSIQVRRVAKLLTEHGKGDDGGVSLFHFAINPESFSNTVENLFYISFLIKEGKARLYDGADGFPRLAPATPATDEDAERGVKKSQFVWELDMDVYHDIIRLFSIESCIIPTRKAADIVTGTTANGAPSTSQRARSARA
ncbi:uncharacterized protein PFL1_06467 [Pseudozyma flocculosa PF-1]|uniref:Non-structural maintenance of chromosomes element 4 n=2 Tax=Pseudozyma flocculosa TaxID=84751 RepID=A0A5C3EWY6_9BASI|nr:uncharacterized protein PFL1_06467 [Pseudozyma flocculosa PF-1]EPQ26014.1 hypothetical protein PFL1_06467 [Pseudozyma flocculosa PF-1]SPO35679.1 related to DNA repair protein Rad62 [Pseudozyma flocculosa]